MDLVLTIDVGSSSARTLLFSADGKVVDGYGSQIKYRALTTEEGGWEIDARQLVNIVVKAVDDVCAQMRAKGIRPAAVAVDTFWHSIMGIDSDAKPVTPILHPFDSRSANASHRLARGIDNLKQHRRTGCMLHPSYPPPKLLWLSEARPEAFRAARRWMSAGEYLFLEFFGQPIASTSMISACGLWDQNKNVYDDELIDALPISREQFALPEDLDRECRQLAGSYTERWPELNGIPWYPALGDGACDNIGSGCTSSERWALMVGTSGAMRATFEREVIDIPDGLFCYRVDRRRFVAGGALSNGGEVFAWMKR
ncbi:MAG: carbohydrate kinase, partial [Acidobacteriota bacterium]|nr:carbohydrate kinase [Acidobacteriota bacterium]